MHVAHCFTVFSMSAFIFTQYTNSGAKGLIFLYPHGCYPIAIVFVSFNRKGIINYSFTFHGVAINHCQFTSYSPLGVSCYILISMFCVASPVLYVMSTSAGGYLLMLPPVCFLWMCIMPYLLMC